ncbi:MAG TPA: mevalonate kinase [Polyangiaceae bacterium]|nr:mevalonate kinase [Polyangiaceae bacterium]
MTSEGRETSGHACGKLILAGEHAVVYGVPAIALGIDRGASARARELAAGPSRLRITTWSTEVTEDDGRELGRALASLLASVRAGGPLPPLEIEAEAELPAGGGLGCSAALGVAIARAASGFAADPGDAREHAMAWEKIFHGNPSGVDAAVAALGGTLQFVRDGERSHIEPITARAPLVFAVGHSGTASSTRSMVEAVARQRAQRPAIVDKTFEGIGAVVSNARLAIEAGDRGALGKLLDLNQMLLAGLLLSTQEIEAMCSSAREAGALGAKLTGAGGGGCVIALVESRPGAERVLSAWKGLSFEGFVAELRAPSRERIVDLAEALPSRRQPRSMER